ncbi:flagellar hook protein FlgE [Rhizomicrobium electricum]|uniref:Flagellar hook protein FlgE n=1 Tax=Rhizomicrobium electricum TaxID=480070 RepID=A0ABP3Q077_9PROT|nr:flagellar hook protein FlgE [Rhizomicrobium electricum]NIJ49554.1 flagellar hook protein FlgE [Rhizomicrobium electricum]
MSLYGAMMTGVAGLSAYSNSLSVASANIANVNTIGYKNATADFSTLLASASANADTSSGSVMASAGQNVSQQGLLQTTSSTTDLAISGNGFFVVAPSQLDTSTRAYTRSGSFTADANGYLKNSANMYLLGWRLDNNGNVPSDRNNMTLINANSLTGKAEATTKVTAQLNLQRSTATETGTYSLSATPPTCMANGSITADFQRTINVYDSQGGQQPLQVSFVKTGANTWKYEVTYQGDATTITGPNANVPSLIANGTATFNPDGTLAGIAPADGTGTAISPNPSVDGAFDITIPFNNSTVTAPKKDSGLLQQTVNMNFGPLNSSVGLTQFDSASNLSSSTVNGALFGSLTGVTVDKDGIVTAQFSNGLSQKVYKVPLATFANPDGLSAISGNAYTTSNKSGSPTISEANLGAAGTISAKNLEGSTVDLATEFTNLITTQRAYSAASKIVTTASTMLDELLQMAR